MKSGRFSESQIIAILKEAESGLLVKEVCRKHEISVPTHYKWKLKYGGLEVSELKRVKELEAENSRLRQMYANLSLERDALKEMMVKKG